MTFIRFAPALTLLAAAVASVSGTVLEARGGNSCSRNEWWFDQKGCCLPNNGPSNPPSPPSGSKCPSRGWYWHSGQGCCVPQNPSPPAPTCDNDWEWHSDSFCCKPKAPSNNCKSTEFWFGDKSCCLPNGGPPSPPSPPSGSKCPSRGWYWHSGQGCCVPQNPSPPTPTCDNNWNWHGPSSCCKPNGPQPSSRSLKRSAHKNRQVKLCPFGLEACPISALSSDFECLDTKTELESCGGCASIGQGQDCTAIPGAWNVGCDHGKCKIFNCSPGFTLSHDGKSCISL